MKSFLFLLLFPMAMLAGETGLRGGEFYFEWGYNTEWYSKSNIHVVQNGLNNDFNFVQVQAHDHIGWDKLFARALTIPQYNYRIGYYFGENHLWGFEINFDHTKYVVTQGQNAEVKGKVNGRMVDSTYTLTTNVLMYQLNNGANFFLLNIVRRFPFFEVPYLKHTALLGVAKYGIGPLVPHVQNTIFGNANDPHFQVGGINTGLEAGLQLVIGRHVYLEFTNKVDYANYFGLRVYGGEVNQQFFTYELIGTLGIKFGSSKAAKCDCPQFK